MIVLMKNYPQHLIKLMDVLKKLPGVGSRSAERYAFDLITWPQEHLTEMARVLAEMKSTSIIAPSVAL